MTTVQFSKLVRMEKLAENYSNWMNTKSDPRVDDWPLMASPFPIIAICASYLVFGKFLHIWMKPRKPADIRWMIWCFDFFHLTASGTLIFFILHLKLLKGFNFRCQPLDPSPAGDKTVSLVWWFFVYNITFFVEIFIFVLGKRHDRITNYFLYHHIALPISIWWIAKFSPTGHSLFFGFVNCSTHVFCFGYLALIGALPGLKKYFWWWKRFFHCLLMLRIAFIVLHGLQLFIRNDCNYPMVYPYIVLINTPFFLVLTILDHLLRDRRIRKQGSSANHWSLGSVKNIP